MSSNEDLDLDLDLQSYLLKNGCNILEGYSSQVPEQVNILKHIVSKPDIQNVLEIGFNAGHSAEIFLKSNPTCNVLSFDLGCYAYTYTGKEYIDKMYPNRHKLVIGNSTKTVPSFNKYNKSNKGTKDKYDLIFIDGGHTYPIPKIDLFNCKSLAHKDTIVIMDDTLFHHKQLQYTIGPTRTWFELTQNKLIEEIGHIDFSESRGMSWGKYL
jgi:predicted O-methyltransferase YrrM